MGMKGFQILLVITAVLCGMGIAAALANNESSIPRGFTAPGWVSVLKGLAPMPSVSRREVTQQNRPFPSELTLERSDTQRFSVAPAPDTRARELEFRVIAGRAELTLRHSRSNETDNWPSDEYPDEPPRFIVREPGGTLIIKPQARPVRLRMVQ